MVQKEYDVIIAGGGTAGCVLATRLSEDPNLSVLVIERGETDENNPISYLPANFIKALGTPYVHNYLTDPHPDTGNRSVVIPVGNILGGGSSINWLMYTRPSPSDFDDWGMKGWTFDDVLPYFKKIESYELPVSDSTKNVHGSDGPLKVSRGDESLGRGAANDFLVAAEKVMGPAFSRHEDVQAFTEGCLGGSSWARWVDGKTGLRSGASSAYLRPNMNRSNLTVVTNALVNKITIENGRATGLEVKLNHEKPDEITHILAKKQVILSAGTFESPKILELSGIGNPEILKAAGLETKVELKGVGENYQDHILFINLYHASPEAKTHDDFQRAALDSDLVKQAHKDLESGKGWWTTNSIDGTIKWRPTPAQAEKSGFKKIWDRKFANKPDKPLFQTSLINGGVGDFSLLPPGNFYSSGGFLNYPEGRGSSHIKSASIHDDPAIKGFYLDNQDDMDVLKHCYKMMREVARLLPNYRGEFAYTHPQFVSAEAQCIGLDPETAKANVGNAAPTGIMASGWSSSAHLDISSTDAQVKEHTSITYTEEDDAALETWLRANAATTWHPLGTCQMNTPEKGGVVDERCNVYGVKGLKVCDLSICPLEPSGNTCSTAYVIGERAAALIKEDLGSS